MKRIFIILMLMLIVSGLYGQSAQNTNRWDLWSGSWDLFVATENETESDSVWFTTDADGDTFFTEPFKVWPEMSVQAVIIDTCSLTDSVKLVVDFLQYGGNFTASTATDSARFIWKNRLSWYSIRSCSPADTITAVGSYGADITEDPILKFRWGRFRVISCVGNKKDDGNWGYFVVNGWNNWK